MVKVTCKEDCGNSPRKMLLRDLNIAFANGDVTTLLAYVAENIQWDILGDQKISGKDEFKVALESMKEQKAVEMDIENIITHGATAAVNGVLRMEDGTTYDFCDVYVFAGHAKTAKIRAMTSYVIPRR